MLQPVLETVSGVLDRRFLRNAFFLGFAFVAACVVVALAGLGRLGAAAGAWASQPVPVQLLLAVGFIALVWFVAAVADSQTRAITQAYEGYWGGPLGPLRRHGERRHQRRLDDLRTSGRVGEIYLAYPLSRKQVMATRLGNILRAAERYPLDRYGADGVLVWPRLYPLLPDRMVTSVAQARGSLEFLLTLSALAAVFAVASGVYLVAVTAPPWLFLLCFWGGLAVAVLAYRAGLSAAVLYAEVVRSAFDLYRLDVLSGFRLPPPADARAERDRWRELHRLVLRNDPLPQPYPNPAPKAKAADD
jgi:hypothetical protein